MFNFIARNAGNRPTVAPMTAPAAAQRPAAPRVRCQAISANVDSAKPVRAKRAFRIRYAAIEEGLPS